MNIIISFFKNNITSYGVDYSSHPDLIYQTEVTDFDPNKQIAELVENNWEFFSVKISDKPEEPKTETETEKFARIFAKIIDPNIEINADTDTEILEGVDFSDTDIGDVIAYRVFPDEKTGKLNPHGQMAMIAKILANPAYANTAEVIKKVKQIDEIRAFFGLSKMTPEDRTAYRSAR